jgi:hypothetical protein
MLLKNLRQHSRNVSAPVNRVRVHRRASERHQRPDEQPERPPVHQPPLGASRLDSSLEARTVARIDPACVAGILAREAVIKSIQTFRASMILRGEWESANGWCSHCQTVWGAGYSIPREELNANLEPWGFLKNVTVLKPYTPHGLRNLLQCPPEET